MNAMQWSGRIKCCTQDLLAWTTTARSCCLAEGGAAARWALHAFTLELNNSTELSWHSPSKLCCACNAAPRGTQRCRNAASHAAVLDEHYP